MVDGAGGILTVDDESKEDADDPDALVEVEAALEASVEDDALLVRAGSGA